MCTQVNTVSARNVSQIGVSSIHDDQNDSPCARQCHTKIHATRHHAAGGPSVAACKDDILQVAGTSRPRIAPCQLSHVLPFPQPEDGLLPPSATTPPPVPPSYHHTRPPERLMSRLRLLNYHDPPISVPSKENRRGVPNLLDRHRHSSGSVLRAPLLPLLLKNSVDHKCHRCSRFRSDPATAGKRHPTNASVSPSRSQQQTRAEGPPRARGARQPVHDPRGCKRKSPKPRPR